MRPTRLYAQDWEKRQSLPQRRLPATASEPHDEKEQRQSDDSDAVRPDRTTACRPRGHQDFGERQISLFENCWGT